jgi:hypothetical protein
MSLGEGIPEPLNKLCGALLGWGKQTAIETYEARAAEVIRVLALALMHYQGRPGSRIAHQAMWKACDLAASISPPQASCQPPDKDG